MKNVYWVGNGFITRYVITKETKCYYYINKGTYEDRLPKDGIVLYPRLGGTTVATTDILEASVAAQRQINTINDYLDKQAKMLSEANNELTVFIKTNLVEED